MNKLFLRTIKRNFVDRRLINPICKHYQLDIMRQPEYIPIFIILPEPIVEEQVKPVKEKLVIPGPPDNEFDFLNEIELKSVRILNESFANRPKIPIIKPIITPNSIRTERLVIPGPPRNELKCL